MPSSAYETTAPLWASSIPNEAAATGMVQGASCSVIGKDALVTLKLVGAVIGGPQLVDALQEYDGVIP